MLCERCRHEMQPPVYRYGPLKLDMGRFELRVAGHLVYLNTQEMMLLQILMENAEHAVSKRRIWHTISQDSQPRIVDTVLGRVRNALGRHAHMIRAMPGVRLMLDRNAPLRPANAQKELNRLAGTRTHLITSVAAEQHQERMS